MAELDRSEELEQQKEMLKLYEKGQKEYILITKSIERLTREIEKSQASFKELTSRINTEKDAHKLLSKGLEDERRQLERSSKTKKQKEEEWLKLQQETLDSMKDATEEEKKFVEATFKATATVVQSQEKQKKFGETVDKVKSIFEPFGKAASTVISGYQSSSSQIGMATAVTSAGLQLATDGAAKVGEGLKGLGAATAGSTSRIGKIGSAAATGVGYLFSFGSALGGLAQKVLPNLTTELTNYIGAFQGMSSSGALFTGGLQGMADAGKNAGLNLTQFASVVKQNQSALAASGLGVGEAAKKMGDVGKVFDKDGGGMRKSLLNLGYSYEEQAGLVAETMAQMRQSGGGLKATDKQVADQTMKYADNLRMIATLTGDDAKGRMKAAQDAANNLAFQQKMDGMTAEQKAGAVAAMAVMSADEKKAFMEVAVNGRAVTTESAILMQQVPALGAKINQSIGDFNAGVLDGQKQLETNAQYQSAIHKDLMANTGIAAAQMAGIGGVIGSAATSMGAQVQENNKYAAENLTQAKKNLEDQKNQGDGTLQGKMNNVIVENQKALIATQNAILKSGVMEAFASAVAASTAAMTNMIKQFGGEGGGVMGGIKDFFTSPSGVLGLLGGAADALSLVKSIRGGPGALGGGLGSMPKPPGPGGASGFFGKAAEMGKSAMSGASGLLGSARTAIGGAAAGVMGGAGVLASKAGEAISGAAGGAASALGGGGAKAVEKVAGKEAAEIGAKAIGKSLLKKIPGISIVAGLGFGLQRALSGDFIGAAGEVASGVAATIPGVGTAASMAIDAGLAAKDAGLFDKKDEAVPAKPSDQGVGTPTSNLATQTQQFAAMSEQAKADAIQQLAMAGIEKNALKEDQLAKAETKTTLTDVNATLLAVASLMDEQLQYMRAITANTGNTVSAVS